MAIELSKRLQDYLDAHSEEGIKIADIDTKLLVEMVTVASDIPEQSDGNKQTKAFEAFFHTDKNYGGACYELERRGYELFKYWREKGLPLPHDAVLYEGEAKTEPVPHASIDMDEMMLALFKEGKDGKKPVRIYVDAYEETSKQLAEISKAIPHGIKSKAMAKLLANAVSELHAKVCAK